MTKLAGNIVFGIDRLLSWKQLTGQEVNIRSERDYVCVTLYFNSDVVVNATDDVVENVASNVVENLNDRQKRIIKLLRQEPTLSASQLAQQVSSTLRTVQRDLARLRYLGIISRNGSDKGGYWKFTDRSDVVENVTDDVVSNVVENLNDRQNRIIELLRQVPTLSASQLAQRLDSTERTVQRDLARLRQIGLISRTGSDKGGYWTITNNRQ